MYTDTDRCICTEIASIPVFSSLAPVMTLRVDVRCLHNRLRAKTLIKRKDGRHLSVDFATNASNGTAAALPSVSRVVVFHGVYTFDA